MSEDTVRCENCGNETDRELARSVNNHPPDEMYYRPSDPSFVDTSVICESCYDERRSLSREERDREIGPMDEGWY